MSNVKLLSLNVEFYNRLRNPSHLSDFGDSLSSLNCDLICLQEDSSDEKDWIKGYSRIVYHHSRYCTNSIWCKNSKLKYVKEVGNFKLPSVGPSRFCVFVNFKDIIIANTHLTGGRYDDVNFKTNTLIKDQQVYSIIKKTNPDIILGDFNGDVSVSQRTITALSNYYFYNNLNSKDKQTFIEFWSGGHSMLKNMNYKNVFDDYDEIPTTSIFNSNPDHIYYKKNILVKDLEIIDTIKNNYTDHNGIIVEIVKPN